MKFVQGVGHVLVVCWRILSRAVEVVFDLGYALNGGHSSDPSARAMNEKREEYRP